MNPTANFPIFNPQTGNFNSSRLLDVVNGDYTTYTQGFPITTISVPPTSLLPFPFIGAPGSAPAFVDPPIPIDQTVLYAFETVLTFGASQNYPPTVMSRYFYMWFMSMVTAWNWVLNTPALPGTKDGWDFTVQTPLNYDDSTTWMVAAVEQIMTDMSITGYNSSYLWNRTKTCHGWDDATLAAEVARIQALGHWDQWRTALAAWRSVRNADGSAAAKTAGPIPTDTTPNAQYKNANTTLDPSLTVDPATYTAPTQWTPLVLNGVPKRYASPTWYNVVSTCPTAIDYTALSDLAAPHFPSTPERRYADLSELLTLTATMTDHDKLIAEWWAGGPNTVTPPGIFMWYWKDYMATYDIAGTQGINAFMLSGLQLTVGLFETSRVIWAQKLLYTQARPIQDIRRLWRGQTVTGYDGQPQAGEAWMPYQEANFVTPPFPDFPSGHSGFSSMFANIMGQWFGTDIDTTRTITMKDLSLITFDLAGSVQTHPFGTVVFPQGSSRIQAGLVPAQPTAITFTTWHEMAESAGLSRRCGGIHCISAHQGSVAIIGNLTQGLYKMVKDGWSF
jgi:membrane-associated phospholipid phosphatase